MITALIHTDFPAVFYNGEISLFDKIIAFIFGVELIRIENER